MKVSTLITKLQEVAKLNPESTVYITGVGSDFVNFSGFSVDDLNDITLYEVGGDEPA